MMVLCGGKVNCMTEAEVTLALRKIFLDNRWQILAFDFPQSGTGTIIQQDNSCEKNKNAIVPDLVAKKANMGIYLENKNRFFLDDFEKINELRNNNKYNDGISKLFGGLIPDKMWYGIGIPDNTIHIKNSLKYTHMIDILITVDKSKNIFVRYSDPEFYI